MGVNDNQQGNSTFEGDNKEWNIIVVINEEHFCKVKKTSGMDRVTESRSSKLKIIVEKGKKEGKSYKDDESLLDSIFLLVLKVLIKENFQWLYGPCAIS